MTRGYPNKDYDRAEVVEFHSAVGWASNAAFQRLFGWPSMKLPDSVNLSVAAGRS